MSGSMEQRTEERKDRKVLSLGERMDRSLAHMKV